MGRIYEKCWFTRHVASFKSYRLNSSDEVPQDGHGLLSIDVCDAKGFREGCYDLITSSAGIALSQRAKISEQCVLRITTGRRGGRPIYVIDRAVCDAKQGAAADDKDRESWNFSFRVKRKVLAIP
jgi:hypothetical protein